MQRDLIYDVGMNNGDDTAYYLHRGFRVVAIEADPDLCAKASLRFAEPLKTGQLVIVNAGIAPKPGVMDFWICETNNHWNSFDRKISSRDGAPHHRIPVPCQTFDAILKPQGIPFYLKIDIEGHDYLCVEALKTASALPAYLSVELGGLDYFLEKLTALGYTEFKCISQFNYLPLQLPASPEQTRFETGDTSHIRRWGDWVFPQGASGPFGEDTFGLWLGANEIRRVHQYYLELRDKQASSPFWYGKEYSFWLDLHARRKGVATEVNGAGLAIHQAFRQSQDCPDARINPVLVPTQPETIAQNGRC
jgi:FkbM family methyltransferase